MEKYDNHLSFDLPKEYVVEKGISDNGEPIFQICHGKYLDENGVEHYQHTARILMRGNLAFNVNNNDKYISLSGNIKNFFWVESEKMDFIITMTVITSYLCLKKDDIAYVIVGFEVGEESVYSERSIAWIEFLNCVYASICLDGIKGDFEPLSAKMIERIMIDRDEQADENNSMPVAKPFEGQHTNLDTRINMARMRAAMGAQFRVTNREMECAFEPINDNTGVEGRLKSIFSTISKEKIESFSLSQTAYDMAELFRVDICVFDSSLDREQEIKEGYIYQASVYNMFRSFAWTLQAYCEKEGINPIDVSFDTIEEIVDFLSQRNGLNYKADSYSPVICSGNDIYNYYIPDATDDITRKRLSEITGKYSDINCIFSLNGLREELEYMYPAINEIYFQLKETRNRMQPLQGGVADILYAWCTITYAARQPIYLMDGPMSCGWEHPDNLAKWGSPEYSNKSTPTIKRLKKSVSISKQQEKILVKKDEKKQKSKKATESASKPKLSSKKLSKCTYYYPSKIKEKGYDLYDWKYEYGKYVKANGWHIAIPDGFEVQDSNRGHLFEIVPISGDSDSIKCIVHSANQTPFGKDEWFYHPSARAAMGAFQARQAAQMTSQLGSGLSVSITQDVSGMGINDIYVGLQKADLKYPGVSKHGYNFGCHLYGENQSVILSVVLNNATKAQANSFEKSIKGWMETFNFDKPNSALPKYAWFTDPIILKDLKNNKMSSFDQDVNRAYLECYSAILASVATYMFRVENGVLKAGSKTKVDAHFKEPFEVMAFYFQKADQLLDKMVKQGVSDDIQKQVYKELLEKFANLNNYHKDIPNEYKSLIIDHIPASVTKTIEAWKKEERILAKNKRKLSVSENDKDEEVVVMYGSNPGESKSVTKKSTNTQTKEEPKSSTARAMQKRREDTGTYDPSKSIPKRKRDYEQLKSEENQESYNTSVDDNTAPDTGFENPMQQALRLRQKDTGKYSPYSNKRNQNNKDVDSSSIADKEDQKKEDNRIKAEIKELREERQRLLEQEELRIARELKCENEAKNRIDSIKKPIEYSISILDAKIREKNNEIAQLKQNIDAYNKELSSSSFFQFKKKRSLTEAIQIDTENLEKAKMDLVEIINSQNQEKELLHQKTEEFKKIEAERDRKLIEIQQHYSWETALSKDNYYYKLLETIIKDPDDVDAVEQRDVLELVAQEGILSIDEIAEKLNMSLKNVKTIAASLSRHKSLKSDKKDYYVLNRRK